MLGAAPLPEDLELQALKERALGARYRARASRYASEAALDAYDLAGFTGHRQKGTLEARVAADLETEIARRKKGRAVRSRPVQGQPLARETHGPGHFARQGPGST